VAPPEEMIADEKTILDYIPQRQPMAMVGKLLYAEDKKTVTSLLLRPDNIFVENGFFTEPGLIENMAQTAAAGAGYLARSQGTEPAPGFIGGIRNLRILILPKAGEEITTEAVVEHEIFDATVVHAKVFVWGSVIAECELKIFLMNQKT
jgi:predicted hotdog family 3-hydroxylacyl-ACP dehydratase